MGSAKILLVDDEVRVLDGYRRGLRKKFELDTANSGQEAIDLLTNNQEYAVVVADMRMPGMSGLELLTEVRKLNPDTSRIMLTGNADQQTVIDAVNQGKVYKFLTKPCDSTTLESAIEDGIRHYQQAKDSHYKLQHNASRAKNLARILSHQAMHDPLTGLDNRLSFENHLDELAENSEIQDRIHALCYIDIDHFHVINANHGPVVGDMVLNQVAAILKKGRRQDDLVTRLSDDRFCILFSDCNLEQARVLVEQIQQRLQTSAMEHGGRNIEISASIGLTPIAGSDWNTSSILHTAEAACALAKERGRNITHVADSQDPELSRRLDEVLVASDISSALEEERFRLYYQTIAPLNPESAQGLRFELLIRMLDREGNIHMPGEFLPAAEHYHLSPKIDRWVIRSAAVWLEQHPQHLEKLSSCSINLSGLSLGNQEVLQCITETFESCKVPRNKICFEVTETAAILKMDTALEFIHALKEQGFLFSLDDFGSGYSSFTYLRDLPVDYLKIDGTFVKTMDRDKINRSMVKSIHEIGRAMGIKTIAEFVENEDIRSCLQELEIDFAQGYLIAKPRPLDDLDLTGEETGL